MQLIQIWVVQKEQSSSVLPFSCKKGFKFAWKTYFCKLHIPFDLARRNKKMSVCETQNCSQIFSMISQPIFTKQVSYERYYGPIVCYWISSESVHGLWLWPEKVPGPYIREPKIKQNPLIWVAIQKLLATCGQPGCISGRFTVFI